MTSTKLFLLVTVFTTTVTPFSALAEELAEPPRQLPAIESALAPIPVVSYAADTVARAVTSAPVAPQPAPPLQDVPLETAEPQASVEEQEPEPEVQPQPFAELSTSEFATTLQVLRRFQRKLGDGVQRVDALAARLSDPVSATSLELRPYVAADGWPKLVQLLYDDKCKEAKTEMAKLTGEPSTTDERALQYMWARIQMCAGEADEGRQRLQALMKADDAVSVLAARRLGQKITVKEDEDGEGMYLSGRIKQAKQVARKDADAGLRVLDEMDREMTKRWDKFKIEQARAEILEDARRYDEAAEVFLALYRKSKTWSVNGRIEDQIQALERKTNKRILNYGERIDRMRSLVARGRYKEAREVSVENAKIRGVGGVEIRGWMYYRQALEAERDKKRTHALALFEKANKDVRDSEVRPRLYFGWARALRRTDKDTEAIALYERICKEYAKHHLCNEATYEAGRLLQFKNEHVRAIEKFDGVLTADPDGEHTSEALWRKAFSHYLQRDYAAMRAPLERMRREFGDERDESELTLGLKATYWLAMSHWRASDLPNAERLFQETVDRGPLTWYGRLAAARMTEAGWSASVQLPGKRLTAEELRDLATLRVPKSARLEVAGEFARLGLWRDALAELRTQTAIHPVPEGAHRLLAATYLANGQPNWAHWIMKKHIDESGPTWGSLRDWGTAFPLDYMELSHEHGTRAGVSPFLVQAIIRQESGFRASVSSWAGAVGLMQLMPGTATYTARVFKDEHTKFRRNDLKDPERNVSLGSRYIRLHTAHAKDSIPLALAGYNAGPRPLESWIQRYSDRDLDAWVESITYREARGYVRKVYTSYVTYAALYGGELPTPDLSVPGKLPKWGDVPEITREQQSEPISLLTD